MTSRTLRERLTRRGELLAVTLGTLLVAGVVAVLLNLLVSR